MAKAGGRRGRSIPLVEVVGSPVRDQASSRPRVKGRLRFGEHLGTGRHPAFAGGTAFPTRIAQPVAVVRSGVRCRALLGPKRRQTDGLLRSLTARASRFRPSSLQSTAGLLSSGLLMAVPPLRRRPSLSRSLGRRRPRTARRALFIPRRRVPCNGALWHLRPRLCRCVVSSIRVLYLT